MTSKILNIGLVFFLLILFIKCDTNEPPINSTLFLTLEDVSCTEAWITIRTTNLQLPITITIKQNNQTRNTINLAKTDTLLYIDSLLPNQTYRYQASSIPHKLTSNTLSVTTMDTTSHIFTFETFTFGGTAGSSVLYDVAIINEQNVWAVGEIYVADTSQNGYTMYNAVHWDGSEWTLAMIKTNACGGVDYPAIKTVFSFSDDDILFAHTDGSITKYDGEEFINDCSLITQLNGSANKIWGVSKNDYYVVSDGGFIAHYNGTNWRRIESGTTTDINDVWGIVDEDGIEKIYCAVSFVFQIGDQKILTIRNNKVDSLSWNTGRRVYSLWTNSNKFLYVSGGGIFENKRGYWNEITEVPLYYSRNVRGSDLNNLFVCGDFGFFVHFNGSVWKTFSELYIQGIYYAVAVKNNAVISVGFEGSKAIIVKGIRN